MSDLMHVRFNAFMLESNYAILYDMSEDSALFKEWAGFLKRWGLTKLALSVLDGAGPLTLVFSQLLHMGAVANLADLQVKNLASVLEDDKSSALLADYLRKDLSI
jgi:hypothetical protein